MDNKYFTQKKYVAFFAILCSILWGSAFPALKVGYQELKILTGDTMDRIVFAGMRFFIASIIIFSVYKLTIKKSIKIKKRDAFNAFKLGLLQTALFYFFFYTGLAHTTGVKGSILDSGCTFFVILLAHFAYKNDKISIKKIIGLILGFSGIIFASWKKDLTMDFVFTGDGFILISGFIFGLSTIYAKKLSSDLHPILLTAWEMFLGSIVLLTIGIIGSKGIHLEFTRKAWILLIYTSLVSSVAVSLWYTLLKYNKAGEISLYKFVNPLAGSILSALLIPGEAFNVHIILALLLVSTGIIVVNYTPRSNKLLY
jgi:drug/metabolite transporter (DMT)-like permease